MAKVGLPCLECMRITSAPMSANIMAQKGAGPSPTISMMRMPAKGPVFLVMVGDSEAFI